MRPILSTRIHWGAIALLSTLVSSTARGDVLIDDFSGGVPYFTVNQGAPQYTSQAIAVATDPSAVRTVSTVVTGDPSHNLTVGNPLGSPVVIMGDEGTTAFGWFGGLAGGFPASGSGTVTTSDVVPFGPLLDLSGELKLEIDYGITTNTTGSLTLTVYDATLGVSDTASTGTLGSGVATWEVDLASFFNNVDPASIGGIVVELTIDALLPPPFNGSGNLARVEATGVTPIDPDQIDDFSVSFTTITSQEPTSTYGTQTVTVGPNTGQVRAVSVTANGIGMGTTHSATNPGGTSVNCFGQGGDVLIGWFGGLAGGFPASGGGVVTTANVTPLSPPLDLSQRTTFEIDYGNGPQPLLATLRATFYDATLTQANTAAIELINSLGYASGTYVVDLPTTLTTVDPAAVGGIEVEVHIDAFSGSGGQLQVFNARVAGNAFPSFCDDSDGSLASCPCANPGNPSSGCDIQQMTGGVRLDVLARETAPSNGVTMSGAGFPAASTPASIVIRAPSLEAAPVPFGDGLRCIGTPLVRLAATFASGGLATHTFGHGAMAGTGDFHYQLWFRNTPAMYCTPDAFNLSNGRTVSW